MNKEKNTTLETIKRNSQKAELMLKQLANAKRLMILCNLIYEEKSAGELAKIVDLSSSALSQHLAKLREAGLVSADKRGQMVYYRISSPEAQALLSTIYLIYCK